MFTRNSTFKIRILSLFETEDKASLCYKKRKKKKDKSSLSLSYLILFWEKSKASFNFEESTLLLSIKYPTDKCIFINKNI